MFVLCASGCHLASSYSVVARRLAALICDMSAPRQSAVGSGLPSALISRAAPVSARDTQAFFDFSAEALEHSPVERDDVSIEKTVGVGDAASGVVHRRQRTGGRRRSRGARRPASSPSASPSRSGPSATA